jgi:hypothetical protein
MDSLSPPHAQVRAPRVHLADFAPAVLRFQDDQRASGTLQVLSVTGGLLSLPGPIDQGSGVKLMFLTQRGAVLGAAEMLSPITRTQQPFRFVSLPGDDRRRLGAAIQSSWNLNLANPDAAEPLRMETPRAAPNRGNQPRGRLFTAAAGTAALGVFGLGCALYLLHLPL